MEIKKFNSLDICKLLMAFCVVAIHTNPLAHCTITLVKNIYNSFVSMAVPFFFLSSGFLLAQKFQHPFSEKENEIIIKKYLIKIVKLFLIWTALYLPLAIINFIVEGTDALTAVLKYMRGFFFIGEQYNSWHLWYLLSTIYSLILILILFKLKLSLRKIVVIGCIIFIFSIGISYFADYKGTLPSVAVLMKKLINISIANGRIFTGMFYIPIGIMLSMKKTSVRTAMIMLVGGYLLNVFVENHYLSSIIVGVSSIGFFCVVKSLTLPNSRFYPFARKMSTVIYFIHMYIWSFYYKVIYGIKTFGIDSFLVTSGICLIIAVVYVILWPNTKTRIIKDIAIQK